jgi:hypothetical protein
MAKKTGALIKGHKKHTTQSGGLGKKTPKVPRMKAK